MKTTTIAASMPASCGQMSSALCENGNGAPTRNRLPDWAQEGDAPRGYGRDE